MNKPKELPNLAPVTNEQRYIGMSEPRHGAKRLTEGLGKYIDDIQLTRGLLAVTSSAYENQED